MATKQGRRAAVVPTREAIGRIMAAEAPRHGGQIPKHHWVGPLQRVQADAATPPKGTPRKS